MRQAGSVVSPCPKCGSALEFDTDGGGYGMTIEQCSAGCGHWRTLEKVVPPALARAPWGKGEPAKKKRRATGYGRVFRALLSVLPTTSADALASGEIAQRAQHDVDATYTLLRQYALLGLIERVNVGRGQTAARWRYWRRPV